MLISISTTHEPATDLGYLLHKHPDKAQSFTVAAARNAHVFYPVATETECTATLLLDIDPIALVRGRSETATLDSYVNDRPYAAGSMMSVAIGSVYRTAMNGVSPKQDLADTAIPLVIHLPVVPCRGGPELVEKLFGPLGWQVTATTIPMDPQFPQWGDAPYLDVRLTGTLRLADALKQVYVLLPVLDNAKHYRISEDEVAKLLRTGDRWLLEHPDREFIVARFLRYRGRYVQSALARLAEADGVDETAVDDALDAPRVTEEPARKVPLALQRRDAVLALLRDCGAHRVVDMGCGGGALLRELAKNAQFTEVVGTDVSARALETAARSIDRLSDRLKDRVSIRQSALTYVDPALAGYDAMVLMEVIEHVDPERLTALERSVFGYAKPGFVIVTTPNVEYNVRFETLPTGQFRHHDHRFEWTRAEFSRWATRVADRNGYTVRYVPIGDDDPEVGPPTQAAVFEVVRQ
ncbi:3' terminal RNA ribose 2'-O-methyltransferase Hen1 [Mycolicibacterium sp. BK556]|uniref:3' terminal RNA ribose 2'-O-methyltransferase Hen1 n=1 Tax=unclassified Mycolicibacterium TaxID=2636767 RepID=UPI0016133568|nr:3' terminal RNA ribose 2'-O-methyltransferase Hen1 [Mycolicibacterium sp. BK556]MBB3630189.1 3' terminal RNA ribose 2'-O-methyltransferase Hen1 [Mycolicibacterium sp. BK607]MBB3748188.1 3' terminal RNA ribose 2'-O-methyltransferase Hen1 [Mycolicibacterium sp. BK634]